jgi:beta-aspartyl-peptidase (threonine type)
LKFKELRAAVEEGMAALRRGSSVDGVEAAVRYMEDSGQFNAGKGACLTAEGTVQLDAAMMEGKGLRGAGVGLCECTYNPVSLARAVMEKTDHALIAGAECARFARAAGLRTVRLTPSSKARELFSEMKVMMKKEHPLNFSMLKSIEGNTVGAVAIDSDGIPAAAVSTGGTWMKLPGRIGDSAILGAGIYADGAAGAACATGKGEAIIKCALCWNACSLLKENDASGAARRSIALIGKRSGRGTAGIVTVDLKGRVGFAYNTQAMGRAWYDSVKEDIVVQA